MTNELGDDFPLAPPDEEDEAEWTQWEADQDRRFAESAQKIIRCFEEVSGLLDPETAWALFNEYCRIRRSPKKGKGPHRPDADQKFLADYEAAPKGGKEAIINAFARDRNIHPASAKTQLRRLRAKREAEMKVIAEWSAKNK